MLKLQFMVPLGLFIGLLEICSQLVDKSRSQLKLLFLVSLQQNPKALHLDGLLVALGSIGARGEHFEAYLPLEALSIADGFDPL